MTVRILDSADVDETAQLGDGSSIWHLAQVRERAVLGTNCVVGRGGYVGPGVVLGDDVKIQNYAQIHDPAELGSGVFVGPGAVLTNDVYPRSVDPGGGQKRAGEWEASGVVVGEGASIGAQSVVIAGVRIGAWALVGAGAVVTRDVPDHGLVVGNPAKRIGWVGRSGQRLVRESGTTWRCPATDERYDESGDTLRLAG